MVLERIGLVVQDVDVNLWSCSGIIRGDMHRSPAKGVQKDSGRGHVVGVWRWLCHSSRHEAVEGVDPTVTLGCVARMTKSTYSRKGSSRFLTEFAISPSVSKSLNGRNANADGKADNMPPLLVLLR